MIIACFIFVKWNNKKEKCVIHPQFLLHDHEGDEESAVALANGASNLYAFCQHHTHLSLPHHPGGGDQGFKTDDDLRLA